MQKHQPFLQRSPDDKIQSRMGLKHKLYNIGGEFDLSLFTESNNQLQRYGSMFPQINQPTLEDSSPASNKQQSQDSQLEHYYAEGATERNKYDKSGSSSKICMLEMKVDQLTLEMEKAQSQLKKCKNANQIVSTQLQKTQAQLQTKMNLIERQKKEINDLRSKQRIVNQQQSKNNSLSKKGVSQDSLNNFCAQLLSPEETVQLLQQLLKKVSKSSKMIKNLKSDAIVSELLLKFNLS